MLLDIVSACCCLCAVSAGGHGSDVEASLCSCRVKLLCNSSGMVCADLMLQCLLVYWPCGLLIQWHADWLRLIGLIGFLNSYTALGIICRLPAELKGLCAVCRSSSLQTAASMDWGIICLVGMYVKQHIINQQVHSALHEACSWLTD